MLSTKLLDLPKLDTLDIFSEHLGFVPELQRMYPSPFREERTPSFNIYENNSGELRYKDFGHSQGTIIDFIMNLHNLTIEQAKQLILNDLVTKSSNIKIKSTKKKASSFNIIHRKFNAYDIAYWASQGITLATLTKYKVTACAFVYINDRLTFVHVKNSPTYCYVFEDKVKIYRPFAEKNGIKFIGNVPNRVPQGYEELPEIGETLVITKSLKDVMFLHERNIPAIAPHGEGMPINEEYLTDLKSRFTNFIVVYDNDDPGVRGSLKLTKEIGAAYWNIPQSFGVKDLTDFYRAYGQEKSEELLKSLKKKINEINEKNSKTIKNT